jgi:hypothetical protein
VATLVGNAAGGAAGDEELPPPHPSSKTANANTARELDTGLAFACFIVDGS